MIRIVASVFGHENWSEFQVLYFKHTMKFLLYDIINLLFFWVILFIKTHFIIYFTVKQIFFQVIIYTVKNLHSIRNFLLFFQI